MLNITGNYGNEHFTPDCRSQQEKGKKYILQMLINFHIIYSILKTLTMSEKTAI